MLSVGGPAYGRLGPAGLGSRRLHVTPCDLTRAWSWREEIECDAETTLVEISEVFERGRVPRAVVRIIRARSSGADR